MRPIIVVSGAALIAAAAAYLFLADAVAIFTLPVSAIVMILGVMISPSTKITSSKGQGGSTLTVVDRAVLGTSIYQLFFFNTRLILKRIATAKTTFFSMVILAIAGFTIDRLIGALAGVAAGYALQEYTVQVNRLKGSTTSENFKLKTGDLEVPYDDLEKVQVNGNRLVLFSKRGITKIGLPRSYGAELSSVLRKLIPGKFKSEELVHSPDASREQD